MTLEERARKIVTLIEGFSWADNYQTHKAIPQVMNEFEALRNEALEEAAKIAETTFLKPFEGDALGCALFEASQDIAESIRSFHHDTPEGKRPQKDEV